MLDICFTCLVTNMPSTPKSVNTRSQTSKNTSIDDVMKANNTLFASSATQFQDIRTCISDLTSRVADLVADNTAFRAEILILRSRIDLLESRPVHPSDLTSVIFRESIERSKIEFNVIANRVPESIASTAALRFKDDLLSLDNHLKNLSIPLPTDPKLIRLGNINAKKPRPLKIICGSKNDASQLISSFNTQSRNGALPPTPGFRIVRDKTTLEHDLLRQAHADLERKLEAGSSNFTISFVNGSPTVVKVDSKNVNSIRGRNHRPVSLCISS